MILAVAFLLTFTPVTGATGYRGYVNNVVSSLTTTVNSDGTLSAIVNTSLPATFVVSAVGNSGESPQSNKIMLAQVSPTSIPNSTPTVRPTPIGRIGARYPTDLSVRYVSALIDHPTTGFASDHLIRDDWNEVETYLQKQAIFKGFTVSLPVSPPAPVSFAIATRGNPRVLGCTIHPTETFCSDETSLVGGDSFSLWVDSSQLPTTANYQAVAMAKVSLADTNGNPFDSVLVIGGTHDGDPQWLVDGSCWGPMGWSNGGGMYGNETDFDKCAIPIPADGGKITGISYSLWPPLELGVVESFVLYNQTSRRNILTSTITSGSYKSQVNGCIGPDCPLYGPGDHERVGDNKIDRLVAIYHCTKNGLPCTSDNQPTIPHFRTVSIMTIGFGGTLYVTSSYGWPRTSTFQQNPQAYTGWMAEFLGYSSAGMNTSFMLTHTAELITDFFAEATAVFGHETLVGICAGPVNNWIDLLCTDYYGCRIKPTGKWCREASVLWMDAHWFWSIGATPEMYPVGHQWGPGVLRVAGIIHALP